MDKLYYSGRTFKQVGMALQKMGPEAARAVIAEGLRTTPGSDSYNRARTLQRKLSTGESITASELGHLYDALRRDQAQGGSASKQLAEITRKDGAALTEDEKGAILAYKSSESYKINAILRSSGIDALPPELRGIVESMDSVLPKLPKAEGALYRTLSFDDLSDAEGELRNFLAIHEAGGFVHYKAYTSASTKWDGHPLSPNSKFAVIIEIKGKSAGILAGFGNNFEREALFPRNTMLYIDKVEQGTDGLYYIYMREVEERGETDTGGAASIEGFGGAV